MHNDLLFVTIDNGCYAEYLGKCGIDIMVLKADRPPATIYNEILDKTKQRYICFIHADTSVRGIEEAIIRTIKARPGYLLGAVGVNNGYVWSRRTALYDLITADSCCLVVDKDMGLRFDDAIFNDYHLYVEDLCMQAGRVSTLYIDAYDGTIHTSLHAYGISPDTDRYLIHHSYTMQKRGIAWGEYRQYYQRLLRKWPNVQTT